MPDTTNGKDSQEEFNLDSMTSLKNISIRLTNESRYWTKQLAVLCLRSAGSQTFTGALRIRSVSEQLLYYQIYASKGKLF